MLLLTVATPFARQIIRIVLKPHVPFGLKTHQIYEACHQLDLNSITPESSSPDGELPRVTKQKPQGKKKMAREVYKPLSMEYEPTVPPPFPTHPIRSMRYLKKVVLDMMLHKAEIERILVRAGPKDEHGNPQVLISCKGKGKWLYPNETSIPDECDEWRWRLPVEDKDRLIPPDKRAAKEIVG